MLLLIHDLANLKSNGLVASERPGGAAPNANLPVPPWKFCTSYIFRQIQASYQYFRHLEPHLAAAYAPNNWIMNFTYKNNNASPYFPGWRGVHCNEHLPGSLHLTEYVFWLHPWIPVFALPVLIFKNYIFHKNSQYHQKHPISWTHRQDIRCFCKFKIP